MPWQGKREIENLKFGIENSTLRAGRNGVLMLCVLLLTVLPVCASAQQVNETLKQALTLEQQGKEQQALDIYRGLYAKYPRRTDILFRLESLLSRLRLYEEAATVLEARLQTATGDLNARLRLADALYALGRQAQAFAQWDRVLDGTANQGLYALVADRYRKRNLISQAAATYRKARVAFNRPHLFARELAELAEQQARYPEAVEEYLALLQDSPQYRPLVELRFREFALEGNQQEQIIAMLSSGVQAHPGDEIRLRLLVEYALPAGRADAALLILTGTPVPPALCQGLLLRVAAYALEQQAYAVAADAYGALLDRADGSGVLARARLGLAQAQQGRGLTDEARRLYRDLIDKVPNRAEADEARYRLGWLMRNTDGDAEAAGQVFRSLIETGRQSPWRNRALFDLAEILLLQERLDDARATCERIVREQKSGEEADEARFRMAEYHFFSGDFEAAQTLLNSLLTGAPTRYALNDAIALSVLIQDGLQESPEILHGYAVAQKLGRQGKTGSALSAFQALLKAHPQTGLSDRILAVQAEILEDLRRYPEAIQTCRRLIAEVPWSPLCPWALMSIGRVYEARLEQYDDARQAYEAVLTDYPQSLEADDARDRLRGLRSKIQAIEAHRKEAG